MKDKDKPSDTRLIYAAVAHIISCPEAENLLDHDEFGYLANDLLPRLGQAVELEDQGQATLAPYREPATQVDADPAFAWVDVAQDLEERRVATAQDIERSVQEGYAALRDRLGEAQQRLRDLEDVERIMEENQRLKAELALAGPPDAKEQLELMANKLGSAQGEIKALEIQMSALKQALASERLAASAKDRAYEASLKLSVAEQLPGLRAPALASDVACSKCKQPISNEDVDQGWRKCAACRAENPPQLPPSEW